MSYKIKVIFTLSFLLNIVLLGVLLGGLYHHKKPRPPFPETAAIKEEMHKNIRANRADMHRDFKKIKEYKKELKEIIVAEEFDESAFQKKMDDILNVKNVISKRKAVTFGKTLSALSLEDRQVFSRHVLGALHGKQHKKHGTHKERKLLKDKDK